MTTQKTLLLIFLIIFISPIGFSQDEIKDLEKDNKYNWDLTVIYSDWDEWQIDLNFIKSQISILLEYKGKLGENSQTLLDFKKKLENISRIEDKLYFYTYLSQDIDGRNSLYALKLHELQMLSIEIDKKTAWVKPELYKIPQKRLTEWINEYKELGNYSHEFDRFYNQLEHITDKETQLIMGHYSHALSSIGNIFNALSTYDMKYHEVFLSNGETVVATPANSSRVCAIEKNQNDRKVVFEAVEQAYTKNKNTYAEIWIGNAQARWAEAQLKGYKSCLESVLEPDKISKEIYQNLIDVASNNTETLLKYRELRIKALGLDVYYGSDESIELLDYGKEYLYENAVKIVLESLKPMGEVYSKRLNEAVRGGWIDVFQKPGKFIGAYNWSTYSIHPYILLNWNGTRGHVFTLAHELGHAMHSVFSDNNQPFHYAKYSTLVAETASTFNEKMLLDYLIKNAKDPNEKIILLVQAIDNISRAFFRQTQFAEFEYTLYDMIEKDEPLNVDVIANNFAIIDKKYNGDIIERSEDYPYSWPKIHHFCNSPFYVYNYAVSFSCSSSLFNQIKQAESKEEAQKAQEKYLELLKSGGSDYPVELLKKAGVDLTTKEPYLAVVKRLEELVNELEVALKEAGKI